MAAQGLAPAPAMNWLGDFGRGPDLPAWTLAYRGRGKFIGQRRLLDATSLQNRFHVLGCQVGSQEDRVLAPSWPKVASSIPSSILKKAVFLSHRELLSQNV